jgi:hypothetical protein
LFHILEEIFAAVIFVAGVDHDDEKVDEGGVEFY